MKYKIAPNNCPWDDSFRNIINFTTVEKRDAWVLETLFNGATLDWEIEDEQGSTKLTASGGTRENIYFEGTIDELEKHNTILIKEDDREDTFYFMRNIVPMGNNNTYTMDLFPNIALNTIDLFSKLETMELNEGHINDKYALDMEFNAGYKKSYSIKGLDRKFDIPWENKEINMINNQWMYLFIKSSNTENETDNSLFRLNGQKQPYRVLVAPLNEIVIEQNNSQRTNLVLPEDNIGSSYSTGYGAETGSRTRYNPYDVNQDRKYNFTNEIDETKSIKIELDVFSDNVKVDETNEKKVILEITQKIWKDNYTDKWGFICIGSEWYRNKINNYFWTNTEIPNTFNKTVEDHYGLSIFNPIVMLMRYNTATNSVELRTMTKEDYENNSSAMGLQHLISAPKVDIEWVLFIPTPARVTFQSLGSEIQEIFYGQVAWEVEDADKFLTVGGLNLSGTWTVGANTRDYSYSTWNTVIKGIFQGEQSGAVISVWNNNSLVDYINKQANVIDGADSVIISGKISSVNPLELDSKGMPLNIFAIDSTSLPDFPADWDNTKVYELFKVDMEKMKILNTYELPKDIRSKSWLKGLEAYSIVIENNKEFLFKPELVYLGKPFYHLAIPSPSAWVERIVWDDDINNEGYEWENGKEFLFATNAFNEYQMNNPKNLEMAKLNNAVNLITGVISGGSRSAVGVALGGAGGAMAGASQVGNAILGNMSFKANLANIQQEPAISTGSGSAYSDLYMNKNAFGLSIVEWIYTTKHTESLIKTIIRDGMSFEKSLLLDWIDIQRPAWNYLKISNPIEAMRNIQMSMTQKDIWYGLLENGVRIWNEDGDFMDYSRENGSLFYEGMVRTW